MWTRRTFLTTVTTASLGSVAMALPGRAASQSCEVSGAPPADLSAWESAGGAVAREKRFGAWFQEHAECKDGDGAGLVYNFFDPDKKKGSWLFPMLSAKWILWRLQRGDLEGAKHAAEALFRWQQIDKSKPKSFGAFPSQIEAKEGRWASTGTFYSGDNLSILEALVLLYEKTGDKRYLNRGIGIGTWITSVMSQGHKYGVWAQDHGAPMQSVNIDGAFVNRISVYVESLWMPALLRLGKATGEASYCRQAHKAFEFYTSSQAAEGQFWDHYDPGYPPKPYTPEGWKPYAKGQLISDNLMRAALGACRRGDTAAARKLKKWLAIDRGAVPAYVDARGGGHGFLSERDVYYDVVSSGMNRCLSRWLGDSASAESSLEFLRKVQSPNGGWFWGAFKRDLSPVTNEQAPMVGFWATCDLARSA